MARRTAEPVVTALPPATWLLLVLAQRVRQADAEADALRTELGLLRVQRDQLARQLVYAIEEMEMMRGDPHAPL